MRRCTMSMASGHGLSEIAAAWPEPPPAHHRRLWVCRPSMQALVTICWRFLKSATVDDQQAAPASSPWTNVTLSSATYADAILNRIVYIAHRISPRCRLWAQAGDLNSSSNRCQPAHYRDTRAGRAQAGVLSLRVD